MARLDFRGVGGAVSYGSNATSVGDANAGGASTTVSRSDHVHSGATLSYGSNSNEVGATSAAGASTSVSRADHVHRGVFEITSSSSNTMAQRTINLRAGGNVGFGLDTATNTLTISTAASGSGATLSYASNSNDVGTVDAPGASTLVSRADHVHKGVYELTASSSNTLAQRTVNMRPGTNVAFDVNATTNTLTISATAGTVSGGGGSVSYGSNANSVSDANAGGASSLVSRADHVHKGIGSGTLFPVSPATNDRFFRTDLGLDCYYDGTRWLTVNQYRDTISMGGSSAITATAGFFAGGMHNGAYALWVETISLVMFSSGLTGSAYWTFEAFWVDSSNTATSLGSVNSSADSNSTWYNKILTIGSSVSANIRTWKLQVTKTSTPNSTYWGMTVNYRLIVT